MFKLLLATTLMSLVCGFGLTKAPQGGEPSVPDDYPYRHIDKMLFGNNGSHDFGVVKFGAYYRHDFKITNHWSVPIKIVTIRASMSPATFHPEKYELNPGESCSLTVTLNASRFVGPRTINFYVTVDGQGVRHETRATIQATSVRDDEPKDDFTKKLFGDHASHDFGVISFGTQCNHDFKITNRWDVPITIVAIKTSWDSPASARCEKNELKPGESCNLTVMLDARLFTGERTIHISTIVDVQGVKRDTKATIQAKSVRDDFEDAFTKKLFGGSAFHDFGFVKHGTLCRHDFKITNRWNVPIKILEIRVPMGATGAHCDKYELKPGDSCNLTVTLDARRFVGEKETITHITVQDINWGIHSSVVLVRAISVRDGKDE